jgi:hypothetical protein
VNYGVLIHKKPLYIKKKRTAALYTRACVEETTSVEEFGLSFNSGQKLSPCWFNGGAEARCSTLTGCSWSFGMGEYIQQQGFATGEKEKLLIFMLRTA